MTDHISQLQDRGYTVVPDVIPTAELSAIRQSILESTEAEGTPDARERGIGHVGGFMRYNQAIAPYIASRKVLDPVEAYLDPLVKVSYTTATINMPGNPRGKWHADWPFNQNNAGRVAAPYRDLPMHITTLWMLSAFTAKNGGTLLVPGSHRQPNNPTGDNGVDPDAVHPNEINAEGPEGSVLILDSRIWHSTAPNTSDEPRVSVVVRYAPWWLNTRVLMPESLERKVMVERTGRTDNEQPSLPRDVYDRLPADAQPLFSHWLSETEG